MSARFCIRPARPDDVDVLHRFVVELAEAEQFPDEVTARPDDLARALFSQDAVAEAVVATLSGRPVGFALYYPSHSTIVGRPGLHLEDLYVCAEHRGAGLGLLLLAHLAHTAVQRGCGRLEWWVLRTNDPALRVLPAPARTRPGRDRGHAPGRRATADPRRQGSVPERRRSRAPTAQRHDVDDDARPGQQATREPRSTPTVDERPCTRRVLLRRG